MTHDERVHYHMYKTLEGIAEHAERIVRLEELALDMWELMDGGGLTTGARGPCKEILCRMHELGINARCKYELDDG